ncbi:MAG: bifunctional acetate--CoA ligase family protein/GNAT family N-acetyltransferase, partial [Burkholderiales bacterium]
SIALFGASERENSVGAVVLHNLLEGGFKGRIFAINPKHDRVQGQRCHRSVADIDQRVDLAVVAAPAQAVPGIIDECGQRGIRNAVVLSAGFREIGKQGRALEDQVVSIAQRHGLRFVGPNCLGIMRPAIGFNATFNKGGAFPGKLALVSQSGALCTAILDWAYSQEIGFSSVISMGISADIGFGEVLDYLLYDQQTESILLYIEGIESARAFLSGLRAAARVKPVMVLKVGRHESGARAALSHTGAMAGSDDVFDAALRRAGVVRGERINDLFNAATMLESGQRTRGERLTIVTNGGGPAAVASDHASDLGIPLAQLAPETITQLDAVLPPTWSRGNPVDIIGDASAERYQKAIAICQKDPNTDGLLVILAPQAMTSPLEVAKTVAGLAANSRKPLLTCWMGGGQVQAGRDYLSHADIPGFRTPESAVDGFSYLTNFYRNQQLLLQTPGPMRLDHKPDVDGARLIIDGVLSEQRSVLTELESMALLSSFGVPTVHAGLARSPSEALLLAESIGFPVVMKIYAPEISHKSDVGGVRLGITDAAGVQKAYRGIVDSVRQHKPEADIVGVVVEAMYNDTNGRELLVGLNRDPVFGPAVMFGAGGTTAEVLRDRAIALPPLNTLLAEDMISRTRVSEILGAFRHMPPAAVNEIVQVLLRISEMACELPQIRELDINPLMVNEHGAVAVDARVVIERYPAGRSPYQHMAIHPYPSHLLSRQQLPEGTSLVIRPIRPEDARIEREFVRQLSPESKYFRFMYNLTELTPEMLARFTQIDYDREMALIAVLELDQGEMEIGVARYIINADKVSCEFAVVVDDKWRRRGIAGRLMEKLIDCARSRGLEIMEGYVLQDNKEMLSFCKSMGFSIHHDADDPHVRRVRKIL